MRGSTPAEKLSVASITDRGLSEKRPMNEDSFLADAGRGIFVVADGVGVAFTRECYERFKCPGVVFRKIEGQPLAVESAIVFRKGARSSVLPAIIAALQVKKKPASVLAFRSKAAG